MVPLHVKKLPYEIMKLNVLMIVEGIESTSINQCLN